MKKHTKVSLRKATYPTYAHTVMGFELGNHKLHYDISGKIENPRAWFVNHCLEEDIHHCGHYDLLPLTDEDEKSYFMMLCEDDFYDEELCRNGGRDIRKCICNYSDDMNYNSDMFFVYLNFLKGKVSDEPIVNHFERLLDLKESLGESRFCELTEKYDWYLANGGRPMSLVAFGEIVE